MRNLNGNFSSVKIRLQGLKCVINILFFSPSCQRLLPVSTMIFHFSRAVVAKLISSIKFSTLFQRLYNVFTTRFFLQALQPILTHYNNIFFYINALFTWYVFYDPQSIEASKYFFKFLSSPAFFLLTPAFYLSLLLTLLFSICLLLFEWSRLFLFYKFRFIFLFPTLIKDWKWPFTDQDSMCCTLLSDCMRVLACTVCWHWQLKCIFWRMTARCQVPW